MNERPIIFSAPMVRAILEGQKTQTRRILKGSTEHKELHKNSKGWGEICPYGKRGDKLWVREIWAKMQSGVVAYRADINGEEKLKWKPSIYMPRAASRITLQITDVRVERLQDISEADAIAEGCVAEEGDEEDGFLFKASDQYALLWEEINGEGSWDKNPWVWVIEFKKC